MLAATELVDLDGAVDTPDEEVRGVEADGSSDQPEREHHQQRVAKVEQGRCELCDLQLQIMKQNIVRNRYVSYKVKTHLQSSRNKHQSRFTCM